MIHQYSASLVINAALNVVGKLESRFLQVCGALILTVQSD